MNVDIKKFDKVIIDNACKKLGIDSDKLTLISTNRNIICKYDNQRKELILRISPSEFRSIDLVNAELDWIKYLDQNGISVSSPMILANNEFVEVIESGTKDYFITLFNKAKGNNVCFPECDEEFFRSIGKFLGRIHSLSKSYKPTNLKVKRYGTAENWFVQNAYKSLAGKQEKILNILKEILCEIEKLPRECDSYGMIHGDFHANNYLSDNGKLTLFDFDDCECSWFINDIAISIFASTPLPNEVPNREKAMKERYYDLFMEGYYKENYLDHGWLKYIQLFIKLREILIYAMIYGSKDYNLGILDYWAEGYMKNRKENIENDIPFLDMDFTLL